MIDLAIIGAGPAALSAAIYAARAGLKVEVLERAAMGGELTQIAKIENYPGFVGAGADLANNLSKQAKDCGAILKYAEVCQINKRDKSFIITTIEDKTIEAQSVLVATGSEPRRLPFEVKSPVSYCAICDGALYKGKKIAVVGGGNSAIQESLHLAELVDELTIYSHSKVKAEPYLVEKLKAYVNVEIKENYNLESEDLADYDGAFVFIGKQPATTFLPKEILDENGYIDTDGNMSSIEGLFAAGDVRSGSTKQVVTAAADGAEAALKIVDYIASAK